MRIQTLLTTNNFNKLWTLLTNKTMKRHKESTLLGVWLCPGGTVWFLPSTVDFTESNLWRWLKKIEEDGDKTHEAGETIIVVPNKLPALSFFLFSTSILQTDQIRKRKKKKNTRAGVYCGPPVSFG